MYTTKLCKQKILLVKGTTFKTFAKKITLPPIVPNWIFTMKNVYIIILLKDYLVYPLREILC